MKKILSVVAVLVGAVLLYFGFGQNIFVPLTYLLFVAVSAFVIQLIKQRDR